MRGVYGSSLRGLQLRIARTWDGREIPPERMATVVLGEDADAVAIEVDAPFADDPSPPAPPGPTEALWEFEVVEVFFLGDDEHYTEVELGPHGHHLVLQLRGRRCIVAAALPLVHAPTIDGARWRSRALLERRLLPTGALRVNAYRICGRGRDRAYFAHAPCSGPAPDFHDLDTFVPWRR
jgi:hypothetical protein